MEYTKENLYNDSIITVDDILNSDECQKIVDVIVA